MNDKLIQLALYVTRDVQVDRATTAFVARDAQVTKELSHLSNIYQLVILSMEL